MKAMGLAAAAQPCRACCRQQGVSANHVGLNKGIGACDRAIYMALGGEMHQRIHFIVRQCLGDGICVANVTMHEVHATGSFQGRKVGAISSVGQRIEGNQRVIWMFLRPVVHEVSANKPSSAGNQYGSGHTKNSRWAFMSINISLNCSRQ